MKVKIIKNCIFNREYFIGGNVVELAEGQAQFLIGKGFGKVMDSANDEGQLSDDSLNVNKENLLSDSNIDQGENAEPDSENGIEMPDLEAEPKKKK